MRIAIVGAGISGLVSAHLLHPEHEIVMYEAASYAGGHAHTVRVDTPHHTHHVDTGFIAFNDRNYPNFSRLLDRLGVSTQPTHMSFSVKGEEEDFEYCSTPRGVFCQPRNLTRPWFLRMLGELPRFNRELERVLQRRDSGESLHDFLAQHDFSQAFVRRLIVPQVSAVWSADPRQMATFPVRFLAEFFANHGMLGFRDRPGPARHHRGEAPSATWMRSRALFASASVWTPPCTPSPARLSMLSSWFKGRRPSTLTRS